MKFDKKIRNLAKGICDLAVKAVSQYSQEVDAIIYSGCMDKNRIEHVLDGMLDFCFDKNMLEQYKRLCRYYYEINQHATAGYVYAYRDMWESNETVARQ